MVIEYLELWFNGITIYYIWEIEYFTEGDGAAYGNIDAAYNIVGTIIL